MSVMCCVVFFFKQKTAYDMRISDWSSDVCSSDLHHPAGIKQDCAVAERLDRGGVVGDDQQGGPGLSELTDPLETLVDEIGVPHQIGRASWRARVCQYVSLSVVAGSLEQKISNTEHLQCRAITYTELTVKAI